MKQTSSVALVRAHERVFPSNRGPHALEVTVILADGARVRFNLPIGTTCEIVAGSAALAITTGTVGADLVGIRSAA